LPVARGLALRHARTGEASELKVDGVFVAIGHGPATALFQGQVEMDAEGYIRTRAGQRAHLGARGVRRGGRAGQKTIARR